MLFDLANASTEPCELCMLRSTQSWTEAVSHVLKFAMASS